jgi:hypothetical protein
MRHALSVRGVLGALALVMLCSPATAERKKPRQKVNRTSVATCTSFDQVDREDDGMDVVVENRCSIRVACSVSWSWPCRPAAGRSRRTQHGQAFTLVTDATETTSISPSACGNDGWEIDDVLWACQPDPEPRSVATR